MRLRAIFYHIFSAQICEIATDPLRFREISNIGEEKIYFFLMLSERNDKMYMLK